MLNFGAKFLLVSTSLSPVLIAVAIIQFERGKPWVNWIWCLALACLLAFLCWLILNYSAKSAQKHPLSIREFERKDMEMLAFLFIYLLPFIRSEHLTFVDEWLTSLYVLAIITISIVHAGAFHFNPVMRIVFGYHFYGVKDRHGVSKLLISKTDLQRKRPIKEEVQTVKLALNVHLHIGDDDA